MALIVQKFGGTSVGSIDAIKRVVRIVSKEKELGNQVVVIVSAMAKETDALVNKARALSDLQSLEEKAEYDVILSSGEQVSCGLLALALQAQGIKARSWLGWQLPILTNGDFTESRIVKIDPSLLMQALKEQETPVIAGFQGMYGSRVTTLGRGGSDTTAAAVAVALNADRCDIYTDVAGVYTADPRVVHQARKLAKVAFEEMLEMAYSGAKVLHYRCVEIAMKHNLDMQVLSSFEDVSGTLIVNEDEMMETHEVTGVTCIEDIISISIIDLPHIPSIAATLLKPLQEKNINVDLIVQNIARHEKLDITFSIVKADLATTLKSIKPHIPETAEILINESVAKISIIGIGMRTNSGVAQKMFQILADQGINILLVSTSEIKISVLVNAEHREVAVRSLHSGFSLENMGIS